MIRRPPRSTRTDTLFPYTTLFRSTSDCEVNLSREFTLGQQPHTMLAAAYQARSLQRRLIDRRRRIQLAGVDRLLHGPQISFGIIFAENIIKTALHQTHVPRHLSAFQAVNAAAGTRLGPLRAQTT